MFSADESFISVMSFYREHKYTDFHFINIVNDTLLRTYAAGICDSSATDKGFRMTYTCRGMFHNVIEYLNQLLEKPRVSEVIATRAYSLFPRRISTCSPASDLSNEAAMWLRKSRIDNVFIFCVFDFRKDSLNNGNLKISRRELQ